MAQNIEMMTYDKTSGTWGDLFVWLSTAPSTNPVTAWPLSTNFPTARYAMVIEATNVSGHPFVIQLYTSATVTIDIQI